MQPVEDRDVEGVAPRGFGAAKSVIMVYLQGGPSHLDTYDMKPGAPAEYRGEFRPIASKVPVVTAQSEGGYYYQLTFLPPGSYTVALTCNAALDDPDWVVLDCRSTLGDRA